jgi:S1-C subfamily serine protease
MESKVDIKSIVRIISEGYEFNWKSPFNKSSNNNSIGTGFFIDSEYILTCCHVVDNSLKIYINIPSLDKEKYEVELISCCPCLDIALLKSKIYKSKHFLELDDSDKSKATDKIIAIGYPLGLENAKYSAGIISGIEEHFFQIDAPINEGNSGGPLLNSNNKVIGINTSKITTSEGIGFSTPIIFFKKQKELMLKNKIIRKSSLLCEFNDMDINLWKNLTENKIENYTTGYYVKKCYKDSNLFTEYGIETGDILLEINNNKVDNYGEIKVEWSSEKINLDNYFKRFNRDDIIKMKFWSSKQKKIIEIDYKLNYNFPINLGLPILEKIDYIVFGGLVLMNFSLNHIHIFKDDYLDLFVSNKIKFKKTPKVIISNILSGSTIKKNEVINEGNILYSINDIRIYTLDDIIKVVKETVNKDSKYIILKNQENDTICLNIFTGIIETYNLAEEYNYDWKNEIIKTFYKIFRNN